jgi:ferritin-like metal-binding protein YciE
MMKSA